MAGLTPIAVFGQTVALRDALQVASVVVEFSSAGLMFIRRVTTRDSPELSQFFAFAQAGDDLADSIVHLTVTLRIIVRIPSII